MPHFTYVAPEAGHHRRRHDEPATHHHHHHRRRRRASVHYPLPMEPERIEAPDFRFCVELGLVIRSRKRNHKTVTGLEEEISTQLTRVGIPNHLASARPTSVSSREWTIASELCIPSRPADYRFGMKLVSPFARFSKRPEVWQAALRSVLHTLHAHFEVTTTHQCFTHIHIAPAAGYWTLEQAKALAKSALYFERCLDALVPPYRRTSVWAKSNRNNVYFAGLPMAQCFERIDKQPTFEGLSARMGWCSASSPTGAALGAEPGADFLHDAFRWDFAGLSAAGAGGFGTVAFRQPPGSASAPEAVAWVMLVGCLARLSCGAGGGLDPDEKPQLKSLGEWLLYEAEWSALPHKALLEDLIDRAVPVTPAPGKVVGMDADAITIDEDQRLRWKLNDRNLVLEKYMRLLKLE
ncbi:hypothetical protein MYCTH_76393 [Thermothelomyces thermophilus ATCC 42464]|uniref:Uncharacterized protein n=1 Tax=Thermothelomyces thermophilus (strain ATCC 42464 / BCRC 31852 / DSM 1799) TaxID=573729 RepID=G2Q4X8_THET4|nr:uncharacterized protein MYCTH_76393 [Thermothelomyces thermophilus ATCC 42464]AEO53715.1 hypothetical protein MYCTH_76393 [Thermothelomyces thermophilus ATCC 42464]